MEDSKHVTSGTPIPYDVGEKHEQDDVELQPANGTLTRALKGRHMQMIAIGTISNPDPPVSGLN